MLPSPKRTNCLKPLVGCTAGPTLLVMGILVCLVACLAVLSANGPEPPLGDDFEPDSTLAAQYEQQILDDLTNASTSGNGLFTLQIEQRALSSWLNAEYEGLLETYDIAYPPIWNYRDPEFQVSFVNDQILFYVDTNVPAINTAVLVTARAFPPTIGNPDIIIDIDITNIEAVGFNLEDDSATLSADLSRVITDQIRQYQRDTGVGTITVTSIFTTNGVMTISGSVGS